MQLTTASNIAFEAHVAGPEDAKRGLLIIHDWWGIKHYNHHWADRFGELGYRTLVVDLYDGRNPLDPAEAGEIMRSIDQDEADDILHTGVEYLQAPQRKLATLGWSFGGTQAMHATLLYPEAISATVMFYSRVITDINQLQKLHGPVLAIFAEHERTWPDKQERFEQAMAEAGKRLECASFDADHGFVNPDSPRYKSDAASASWRITVEFLDRYL